MDIFNYYLVNKLKYVKQAIKNALVNKGIEVADNDTLESYTDKIKDITTLKGLLDYTKSTSNMFSDSFIKELPYELLNFSDTSNVANMSGMFNRCTNLISVPLFDTSNVANMSGMFNSCTNLQTVPLFDTSNVANMSNMFNSCTNLQTVPLFDTSNVANMSNMFNRCTNLISVPLFDTSNVANMSGMFNRCTNLISVPLFDTSNVTNMNSMFSSCKLLQTVPLFDTSNVTNMGDMFNSCTNLQTVKELNMIKATINISRMFNGCTNLTNCNLKNIKANLQIGSGTTYGHLLTIDSLVNIIKELVNVNSSRTLTIGSANLTKIANIYVKLIDVTDEMRAEDELIDSKLPCEVCESMDEGAMLLKSYAYEKKWTLK